MDESVHWLDRLPLPMRGVQSFDSGDINNAALEARLMFGAGNELPARQEHLLIVLHWYVGIQRRIDPNTRKSKRLPCVSLLVRGGQVYRAWGWPSVDNWLSLVGPSSTVDLSRGSIQVMVRASRPETFFLPIFTFEEIK